MILNSFQFPIFQTLSPFSAGVKKPRTIVNRSRAFRFCPQDPGRPLSAKVRPYTFGKHPLSHNLGIVLGFYSSHALTLNEIERFSKVLFNSGRSSDSPGPSGGLPIHTSASGSRPDSGAHGQKGSPLNRGVLKRAGSQRRARPVFTAFPIKLLGEHLNVSWFPFINGPFPQSQRRPAEFLVRRTIVRLRVTPCFP